MATSSERSPPPFPESEDPDALDSEEVGGRDSDGDDAEDLFVSASSPPLAGMDPAQPGSVSAKPPAEPLSSPTGSEPAGELVSEPSDDFVDLTNNMADSAEAEGADSPAFRPDEPTDDFEDIFGSETEEAGGGAVMAEVTVEAAADDGEEAGGFSDDSGDEKTGSDAEREAKEASAAAVVHLSADLSAGEAKPPPGDKIFDPLGDFLSDPPPAAGARKTSPATVAPSDGEGSGLFAEPLQAKSAKQRQRGFSEEPGGDLVGEPLGAASKSTISKERKDQPETTKAPGGGSGAGGSLHKGKPGGPTDIFTEEAVATAPGSRNNGVLSEEETDIFAEATVELSLDSPRSERKTSAPAKPAAPLPSSSTATSLSQPQSAALEQLDEEEEEQEDKFDIFVSVKDPEKIGDGMSAYMAYKVTTETSLLMFRNQTFSVKRRFSDFLGLYEKLSEKHAPNGFIVPPPPEKSILGMTKVKVGKEDSSSADFVERRRGSLERYLQRVVTHPSLIQDPDVREFLEREELPRAVSTQALSGAGFLKMITKATDAVSKMTIKMNESDMWFEEKLQEVEAADQHFRKLHALVESLVVHRKELSLNTAGFAKSTAMLGSAEDNTALSRALSQLAEVEDKMEQLHQDQAANDTFRFAEVITDYVRLLGAVRGSFDHRMKSWQRWQDAQAALQKKREAEAKLLWANKPDKLQLVKEEIVEWEAKVTQYERDFDRVSATVRKEVVRFEKEKTRNFKRQIVQYLECLLKSQKQLIKYWEAFLPEAKAIA
ncbi:sorting nexin-1a [Brachionichthys hirsutus]|uniref:sorting nexin-1a n=1 Tax=Brachionichthys hirsutus TaxID=412623 RepID=UPI003604C549